MEPLSLTLDINKAPQIRKELSSPSNLSGDLEAEKKKTGLS